MDENEKDEKVVDAENDEKEVRNIILCTLHLACFEKFTFHKCFVLI